MRDTTMPPITWREMLIAAQTGRDITFNGRTVLPRFSTGLLQTKHAQRTSLVKTHPVIFQPSCELTVSALATIYPDRDAGATVSRLMQEMVNSINSATKDLAADSDALGVESPAIIRDWFTARAWLLDTVTREAWARRLQTMSATDPHLSLVLAIGEWHGWRL